MTTHSESRNPALQARGLEPGPAPDSALAAESPGAAADSDYCHAAFKLASGAQFPLH